MRFSALRRRWRQSLRRSDRPENPGFVPNDLKAGVIVIAPPGGGGQRLILTNYHVVHGGPGAKAGESQIYVRFGDRRGYYAQIIAGDPRSDLAVLGIDYAALGREAGRILSR